MGFRCRVVLTVAGDKAEDQTHHKYHRVENVSGMQRRQRPLAATIGPVTTKVSMVPTVPQVRMKFTSFGDDTLVCSEPRVMIDV